MSGYARNKRAAGPLTQIWICAKPTSWATHRYNFIYGATDKNRPSVNQTKAVRVLARVPTRVLARVHIRILIHVHSLTPRIQNKVHPL